MKTTEIISYLRKIIRARKLLLKKGKSKRAGLQLLADMDHIQVHLDANRYTQTGIAKFFLRNERRILNIIPGQDSRSHAKLMKEYNRIRFHCESILEGVAI